MDYLYENLGDERFQEFCSALISKEFPNIQVFPVGQPDGGRDTIVYGMDSTTKKFKVFQVKFVRNANEERDLHKWLETVVSKEAKKINALVERGATQYYILTNVRGTAHLDSGSKDKINSILESSINVPSICWWRDDLNSLFEKDPLFKWSFPQILNGQDILNSALFENITENKQRKENVVRAYLADQFEMDSEVKFKQIDLQNKLTYLYTDVPLKRKKISKKDKKLRKVLGDVFRTHVDAETEYGHSDDTTTLGAAEFLLHPSVQRNVNKVLLEGGPGQGKSTISQFVCHVHRAKLLKKEDELKDIGKHFVDAPVRFPIKIDLRHIASWIENVNPYSSSISDDYFSSNWKKSLESFLMMHILYHSSIEEFTVSDFISILKLTPLLIVFDGFDEIANIKSRREVIDFIDKGIHRLSFNAESIQVIVTSRPAAFSDTVVFSVDSYPHFELVDVTQEVIKEYVEKWIKAGRMNSRDAADIREQTSEKLQLPHLRELAKSPMQLAIFLTLLKTKGQSLPNKRTALYDSYINLFFDRESEKSSLVRDKRELIIDIHQYLAWILHSEAEQYKHNGTIKFDDLKSRVKSYLESEGHNVSIADELFDAMSERVCALVSRVQGTFEFEVQPLREYFCAKYLYTTAQNSTAGEQKAGTKPDRFHALLRNFYWQNVVRFFAGCADAGELDMIIQELRDLQDDDSLKYTHYARTITAQILSDYVFTQKPKKLVNVVQLIVDGINIGSILNQGSHVSRSEHILLPEACGRNIVVEECYKQLSKFPKHDYAWELVSIITNNPYNNADIWMSYLQNYSDDNSLTEWFSMAYRLELVHRLDDSLIDNLLSVEKEEHLLKRVLVAINGKGASYFNKNIELKNFALKNILSRDIETIPRDSNNKGSALSFLATFTHPYLLRTIFRNGDEDVLCEQYVSRMLEMSRGAYDIKVFDVEDEVDGKVGKYLELISFALESSLYQYRTSLAPWDCLVESGRAVFGEEWCFYVLAVIASRIKGRNDDVSALDNLDDNKVSLCGRARYARLKSGNVKYWEERFSQKGEKTFVLLLFINWATPRVILELYPLVSSVVKKMKKPDLERVEKALDTTSDSFLSGANQKIIESAILQYADSDRMKYLISYRYPLEMRADFILKFIDISTIKNKQKLPIKLYSLIGKIWQGTISESVILQIRDIYKQSSADSERYYYPTQGKKEFPLKLAQEVMRNCKDYPRAVVVLAERTCRGHAISKMEPIGAIAKRENWFEN
ncbi:NACHT domain-containing protein [Janthinobacterium sp. LB2P49]|uniref:NACHT domain-containing protein n=1 Tax=Janthinobacterium sp. LB2P49 TaxID=3424198 RepID=UPI003F21F863